MRVCVRSIVGSCIAAALVAASGCGGGEPAADQKGGYELAGGDTSAPGKVVRVLVYGPVPHQTQVRALLRIHWRHQIVRPAFVAIAVQMVNPPGPQKVVFSRMLPPGRVEVQLDDGATGQPVPGEKTQAEVWVRAIDSDGLPISALGQFEASADWVVQDPR